MSNCVAYCRVSTDGQCADDKFGIESQKAQIIEFCEKKDMNITQWFIDEGVSGAKEHRPEFDKILNGEVTNPPVKYVVVAKTDRISRDVSLYYSYKALLKKQNLEILSVSEDWSQQDKLTAMILENFLAMAATVERESIRARTSGGRRQKAKQGGYSGGRAPVGYRAEHGRLVIEPKEAETVQAIFSYRDDGVTMAGIADRLNDTGYRTRTGKLFTVSNIQSILRNRKTYEGYYRYGGSDWVKGQHEAILEV